MIELYAITDDPRPPDPPLRAVRSNNGLAVLYAPAERREVTSEALWRHEEVVEALMAERNLLPVRFGTLVRDAGAAVQAVSERRAELAKSLLHGPEILVLDEPNTGLDPAARRDFMSYLQQLCQQEGVTILLTTHFMEDAERCDRVGIMHEGKLVALGAPIAPHGEPHGTALRELAGVRQ